MRAALDATPLTTTSGGLRRYTSELSRALAAGFPEDEFLLVSDQEFEMPEAPGNLRRGGGPRSRLERRWWLCGLPLELARQRADVFHGTDFAVPYLPLRPSVMTVHDVSPWMDPTWHHAAGRVKRRAPLIAGLGLATMAITPSETVRRQAIEFLRLPPRRVVAVPHGGLGWRCRTGAGAPARSRAPYFLYVGALEPRKNLPLLVEAWREVRKRYEVDLALAGRRREDFPGFAEEPGLRLLGEVSDEELVPLYSGALAFVYPSLYEGFGMPVIEAMQCGAAVIASRDAAITEAAGGAAVQVDARDVPGWVEALTAAVTLPERVQSWRARARERGEQFSWARTAELTREVYDEALRRFGR